MRNLLHTRAIVFDAYGTLLNVGSLSEKLTQHFGTTAAQIGPVWRAKQLEYTWLRALMNRYKPFSGVTADALRYACIQQKVELDEAVLDELVGAYYELVAFEEVYAVLERLKRKYQLAVLSNANMSMLSQAFDKNHLTELMDGMYSVEAVQTFKPHPDVYRLAVEGLSLLKNEIAFVSTNTWDVAGAESFGFHTIWLNRFDKTREFLGNTQDVTIHSLQELI